MKFEEFLNEAKFVSKGAFSIDVKEYLESKGYTYGLEDDAGKFDTPGFIDPKSNNKITISKGPNNTIKVAGSSLKSGRTILKPMKIETTTDFDEFKKIVSKL